MLMLSQSFSIVLGITEYVNIFMKRRHMLPLPHACSVNYYMENRVG